MANKLNCVLGDLLVKYLGIPVSDSQITIALALVILFRKFLGYWTLGKGSI